MPNNTPLCRHTTCCLFFHQLVDVCIVSAIWLFWKCHYEHSHTSVCRHVFSFLLCICLGVELLGHMVTWFKYLCSTNIHLPHFSILFRCHSLFHNVSQNFSHWFCFITFLLLKVSFSIAFNYLTSDDRVHVLVIISAYSSIWDSTFFFRKAKIFCS